MQGNKGSLRFISLHEYQSQEIMKSYGIHVPEGKVAQTPTEAESIAKSLNAEDIVIKSQILAGGRGLGTFDNGFKGGVKLCFSPEEVREYAGKMLNHRLITKQTGPEGRLVNKVLIAKRSFIRRETYIAILLDRAFGGPVIVASKFGGVDIETVAKETPEAIITEAFDLDQGPSAQQVERVARGLGFPASRVPQVSEQIFKLYQLFKEKDAVMVEVNPFVETSEGEVMCMDAKIQFDSNAGFRQEEIHKSQDFSQKDPREVTADKFDLNYIGLDGTIGCLVNGAGLAMATMDIIKHYGGSPANFLDVGGGASKKQVTEAIKLLASDSHVRVILVNIFGGIMKCDTIALGLIAACKELSLKIPLVVRLQGTNVKEAKEYIENSGIEMMMADDLGQAAEKAVKAAQIMDLAQSANIQVSFNPSSQRIRKTLILL